VKRARPIRARVERPLPDRNRRRATHARPWLVYVLADEERRTFSISMAKDVDARVFRHCVIIDVTLKRRTPFLVHVEPYDDRHTAILRMQRLRAWSKKALAELIDATNPSWHDLSEEPR